VWTSENRVRYDRSKLRYPSDLTDAEWAHVAPLIPPARRGGNRRHVDEREVVNGLMYILSTGCQWRAVPKDLPPRSTLYHYFDLWSYYGTLDRLHEALDVKCREQAGRDASPTAAILDSQSVKSAEKGAHHKTGARRGVVGYGGADDRSRPEIAAVEDAAAGCSSRSLAPDQAGR
jgi:transposase